MYHSVTFGNKNTWTDWHLVPTSRPVIDPPPVKTRYVEIPGADGVIDLTDSLTGKPAYNNREGSIEFYVLNQYDLEGPATYNWSDVYSEIMTYLHGKRMTMILEDDPGYYYEGRFSVNSWKTDQTRSTITIDYNVDPKKYRVIPAYTSSDFKLGALSTYISSMQMHVEEISANTSAITKKPPRICYAGERIRVADTFRFDIAIYATEVTGSDVVAELYIPYSQISGNEYTFTIDGYYQLMMYKPGSPIISSSDFPSMGAAIEYFPKGVL